MTSPSRRSRNPPTHWWLLTLCLGIVFGSIAAGGDDKDIARLVKPSGIRVTQLAHGIPVGGMIEYTDRQTIGKALENRKEVG